MCMDASLYHASQYPSIILYRLAHWCSNCIRCFLVDWLGFPAAALLSACLPSCLPSLISPAIMSVCECVFLWFETYFLCIRAVVVIVSDDGVGRAAG